MRKFLRKYLGVETLTNDVVEIRDGLSEDISNLKKELRELDQWRNGVSNAHLERLYAVIEYLKLEFEHTLVPDPFQSPPEQPTIRILKAKEKKS